VKKMPIAASGHNIKASIAIHFFIQLILPFRSFSYDDHTTCWEIGVTLAQQIKRMIHLGQKERGTMKKTNQDQAKLKDGINEDLKQQLLQMKQNLAAQTEKREEQKRQDLLRQQKEKEKNKSFSELLDESHLDWRKYKS
jgi:nucleoside 2-deoxyribosyltransferase